MKSKKQKKEKNVLTVSGKRKRAIARATIRPGSGKVLLNKIPYENLQLIHKLLIREPIDLAKSILGELKYDVSISSVGGGRESQIEAARLALAKAIVKVASSAELRKAMISYDKNLLIADIRRKEPYKPGDSKARAKRQKSYR